MTEPIGKLTQLGTRIAEIRKAITGFVLSGLAVVAALETFGEGQGWQVTGLTAGIIAVATALGVYTAPNKQ